MREGYHIRGAENAEGVWYDWYPVSRDLLNTDRRPELSRFHIGLCLYDILSAGWPIAESSLRGSGHKAAGGHKFRMAQYWKYSKGKIVIGIYDFNKAVSSI